MERVQASRASRTAILAGLALAVVVGLSADHVSRSVLRPVPWNRYALAGLLAAPWMASGVASLLATDSVVERIEVPTFTQSGQQALVEMLRRQQVERLIASDYEFYGAVEVLAPEIEVVHGWGAVSHLRGDAAGPLLRRAAETDSHLLAVKASAPMIYNMYPAHSDVVAAANSVGLTVTMAGRLDDKRGVLYRIASD